VLAACRNPDLAAIHLPPSSETIPLDVSSPRSIASLASACANIPIDVLINNAAIHGPRNASGSFGALDVERWVEVFRVNTIGPVKVAEALLPNILAGHEKKLVFISSRAGSISERGSLPHHKTGGPYIYRTSKAALNAAVKAIGYDLRGEGVSVIALHPGWVKTETGGWDAPGDPAESVSAMIKLINQATPQDNGVFRNVDGSVIPW
jgi:NAD(P)-dependent dehydrogenase (short-subunit alcohol dehydrogenase family)